MATFEIDNAALRERLQAHIAATSRKRDVPRRFELTFNRKKLKSANPKTRLDYQASESLFGVLFTTGQVVLERHYVNAFETLSEMEEHFAAIGSYEVRWLDDE